MKKMTCKMCGEHIEKEIYNRHYCKGCVNSVRKEIVEFQFNKWKEGISIITFEQLGHFIDGLMNEKIKKLKN